MYTVHQDEIGFCILRTKHSMGVAPFFSFVDSPNWSRHPLLYIPRSPKATQKKGSIWLPLYPVYMFINPHIPNIRQIDESVGFCSPMVFCHKALGTEISDAASAAPTAALFRKDSSQWGLFILIRGAGSKRCGKSGGRGDDRNNQQHTYESKSNLKIL